MAVILDLNTSFEIDIRNIYAGRSWPTIEFQKFQDDEVTAENYPTGDYTLEVFADLHKKSSVMLIEEGQGIAVSNNSIIITRTISENTLMPGVFYFRVVCEVDVNYAQQVIHGTITIQD